MCVCDAVFILCQFCCVNSVLNWPYLLLIHIYCGQFSVSFNHFTSSGSASACDTVLTSNVALFSFATWQCDLGDDL